MTKKYKITATTVYTGGENFYHDYLEMLRKKMPDHLVDLIRDNGGAVWESKDPDGSTAETTYRVEES